MGPYINKVRKTQMKGSKNTHLERVTPRDLVEKTLKELEREREKVLVLCERERERERERVREKEEGLGW